VALPAIAAFAIYAFRVWSYLLFFGICAWTIGENFATYFMHKHQGISMGWVMGAQALNLIVVSYFLFPGVRATYFNRRLRWWETRPRYKVSVDGTFGASAEKCEILDVSVGGVFLRSLGDAKHSLGEEARIQFELEGFTVDVAAKIVHEGRILRQSYGFQFTEQDRAKLKQFARMVKVLDQKGYITDRRLSPWQEDLKNWFKDAIHTAGRSIVPTLPTPAGAGAPSNVVSLAQHKSATAVSGKPMQEGSDDDSRKAA
jgi:hypothetical protein